MNFVIGGNYVAKGKKKNYYLQMRYRFMHEWLLKGLWHKIKGCSLWFQKKLKIFVVALLVHLWTINYQERVCLFDNDGVYWSI